MVAIQLSKPDKFGSLDSFKDDFHFMKIKNIQVLTKKFKKFISTSFSIKKYETGASIFLKM
jgi:hypothetical protein